MKLDNISQPATIETASTTISATSTSSTTRASMLSTRWCLFSLVIMTLTAVSTETIIDILITLSPILLFFSLIFLFEFKIAKLLPNTTSNLSKLTPMDYKLVDNPMRIDRLLSSVIFIILYLVQPWLVMEGTLHSNSSAMTLNIEALLTLFIATLCFSTSLWLIYSARHYNRYFDSPVSITIDFDQADRLCTQGPYALVRHPGSTAYILWGFVLPFIFFSVEGLILSVVIIGLVITRVIFEEKQLSTYLADYNAYQKIVRWRLFPYIW